MKFLRSISGSLGKRIKVIKPNGEDKTYTSVVQMTSAERMAFVIDAMNSCEEEISPEQYAFVHDSFKNMMIQSLGGCLKR